MKRAGTLTILTMSGLAISLSAAAKEPPTPHLFGPPPSWAEFRRIAEAGIVARLVDPDSAQIRWTGGYMKGAIKPLFEPRVEGYAACGLVNARNRMGGYAGTTSFVVVVDYDRVLFAEIDRVAGGEVSSYCAKAVAAGLFPPLPSDADGSSAKSAAKPAAAAEASDTSASGATGLTLRAMPDGAYVIAVAPGSSAAAAGLKPGMVIASVNAIPLAGMGDAMLSVVRAAGSDTTLTVVGGGSVTLRAPK